MSFISQLLGGQNSFQAQPAATQTTDYRKALQDSLARMNTNAAAQQGLANQLQMASQGQGPSVAGEQLRQGTAQTIAVNQGSLANARGINRGQAVRQTAENTANTMQQAAGQSALQKLQEQLQARGQLASVLGNMGQQAIQGAGVTSGAQNQQNSNAIQNQLGTNQINAQVAAQNQAASNSLAGGLLGSVGTALAGPLGGALGIGNSGSTSPAPVQAPIMYAEGGAVTHLQNYLAGGPIPGKAPYPGDTEANDTHPIMASSGEFVVKRTTMQQPGMRNAMEAVNEDPALAAEFIKAVRKSKRSR